MEDYINNSNKLSNLNKIVEDIDNIFYGLYNKNYKEEYEIYLDVFNYISVDNIVKLFHYLIISEKTNIDKILCFKIFDLINKLILDLISFYGTNYSNNNKKSDNLNNNFLKNNFINNLFNLFESNKELLINKINDHVILDSSNCNNNTKEIDILFDNIIIKKTDCLYVCIYILLFEYINDVDDNNHIRICVNTNIKLSCLITNEEPYNYIKKYVMNNIVLKKEINALEEYSLLIFNELDSSNVYYLKELIRFIYFLENIKDIFNKNNLNSIFEIINSKLKDYNYSSIFTNNVILDNSKNLSFKYVLSLLGLAQSLIKDTKYTPYWFLCTESKEINPLNICILQSLYNNLKNFKLVLNEYKESNIDNVDYEIISTLVQDLSHTIKAYIKFEIL